jgi:4-alpha-glucanotransferase
VLPLGPTGYGDSPYQSFSAFAGIRCSSNRPLMEGGYLTPADLRDRPPFPNDRADYGRVIDWKFPLLAKAAERFYATRGANREFETFQRTTWSLAQRVRQFMAAKQPFGEDAQRYWQFEFFRQWPKLKTLRQRPRHPHHGRCADLRRRRQRRRSVSSGLFEVDEGRPLLVAGVPPDYFSATGQLWGNPIYRWNRRRSANTAGGSERFRHMLEQVDFMRLDHFRGFEAYWQVPATEDTASTESGSKVLGRNCSPPLRAELGPLPIVAENLGVITPEVEAIRASSAIPG